MLLIAFFFYLIKNSRPKGTGEYLTTISNLCNVCILLYPNTKHTFANVELAPLVVAINIPQPASPSPLFFIEALSHM